MKYLALTLFSAIVAAEKGCGDKRPGTLPDYPGSCTDIGKCCDWTWPPPLTNVLSCDPTKSD